MESPSLTQSLEVEITAPPSAKSKKAPAPLPVPSESLVPIRLNFITSDGKTHTIWTDERFPLPVIGRHIKVEHKEATIKGRVLDIGNEYYFDLKTKNQAKYVVNIWIQLDPTPTPEEMAKEAEKTSF